MVVNLVRNESARYTRILSKCKNIKLLKVKKIDRSKLLSFMTPIMYVCVCVCVCVYTHTHTHTHTHIGIPTKNSTSSICEW